MAKKEPLFDLIKSLTQNEKRYFKLHSAQFFSADSKNYVQLFEIIEKLKTYSETAVRKSLSNKSAEKYFSQQKRHLHIKIMESLRSFHASESVDQGVIDHIRDFEIMLQKSLFHQAGKSLHKAYNLAKSHDHFTDMIKIFGLKSKLLKAENNLQDLQLHLKNMKKEVSELKEKMFNELEFEELYVHILKWNKEIEFIRSEKELKSLNGIISNSFLTDDTKALTANSRIRYFYIHGLNHYFRGEFKEAFDNFNFQLQVIEEHENRRTENMNMYLRAVANKSLMAIKLRDYETSSEGILKLEGIKKQSRDIQNISEYMAFLLQLMSLNQQGKFEDALVHIENYNRIIQPIDEFIQKEGVLYNEWTLCRIQMAVSFLGADQYKPALRKINDFLNDAKEELKKDSYSVALIIAMMLHFERENMDVVENMLKSTKRYLEKNSRMYNFEKAILAFIDQAVVAHSERNLLQCFVDLKEKLLPLREDKYERSVFEYFDFIAWLSSKIERVSYAEVIRRQ